MAIEIGGTRVSREAGSDLSANQFHLVTVAADEQVDLTGAGLAADGVLQDNNGDEQGKAVQVMLLGGAISKIKAGAAIAAGVEFTADATGRAVTAGSGDRVAGRTWEAAGAADELITASLYMGPEIP